MNFCVRRVAMTACAVLALSFFGAQAQIPAKPDDALLGLWVSESTWDPGPSGPLTLSRTNGGWHAALATMTTDVPNAGAHILFEIPGHRGTFRGALAGDGQSISGFWIQPHAKDNDPRDPDGAGQTFASPLALKRDANGDWQGTITPLRDTFTLYLKIFRGNDGVLTAAFRNPEANMRGGAAQFQVTRNGQSVVFAAGTTHLTATIDGQLNSIGIRWPNLGSTLTLTRATGQQAAGFYPRSAETTRYIYREPDDVHDGWRVARARDVGMDEARLAQLVQTIVNTDPATPRPNLIHSLSIARRGELVLDEYFEGATPDRQHDLRSAGKTFASVMLGALMHEGVAISPETRLYPLVAGMGPFTHPDPRKAAITLAQLMTHTSGLACDDNDDNSPGNEDTLQSQRTQSDWWKYTLDLPMAHDPGARYAYCSAGMNLMGAALTTVSKMSLPELFDRDVAQPLQWGPYYWNVMSNGQGYLGGGAFVRPRDLLKLGQAYLDGGVWNGRRIVDTSWVEQSTKSRVAVTPQTTGLSADDFKNVYITGADGYAWHLTVLHTPTRDYPAYGAGGNGGQLLVVVPAVDLAVVFTGGNYGQGLIWNNWRDEMIPNAIIPTISDLPAH